MNAVLKKLWKMWENMETIWCQNQIIILKKKFLTENVLAIEMKKTETYINKPVYIVFSILEGSKILMYEFW